MYSALCFSYLWGVVKIYPEYKPNYPEYKPNYLEYNPNYPDTDRGNYRTIPSNLIFDE